MKRDAGWGPPSAFTWAMSFPLKRRAPFQGPQNSSPTILRSITYSTVAAAA